MKHGTSRSTRRIPPALGLAAVLLISFLEQPSLASIKEVPPGARKVFQFSVVGCPPSHGRGSRCDAGSRLFVNRDAQRAQVLVTNGVSWDVLDCDATADNWGEIATGDIGKYGIFVRLHGLPGGRSRIGAEAYEDFITGETLGLLGVIDLSRGIGQSKFALKPSALFDQSMDNVVWSMDGDPSLRIAELRVYQMP